jgi:hypothetical protein
VAGGLPGFYDEEIKWVEKKCSPIDWEREKKTRLGCERGRQKFVFNIFAMEDGSPSRGA